MSLAERGAPGRTGAPAAALAALVALAAACDGGGTGVAAGDGGDGPPVVDAAPADARVCAARDLDPEWLGAYESEVVAKLSGAMPIAPGVTLTDRASVAAREATRAYLLAELAAHGYAPVRHTYESGANVIARLEAAGNQGGPVVVLGAHFDGVPDVAAAADDGTGTALVLAAARWFKELDCRDTDVIFAFFDQEEIGLIGSNFYAAKLRADGEEVVAVHIYDMISYDDDGDQALELWKPTGGLHVLYETTGASFGVPVRIASDFLSSDHRSFLDEGFVTTGVSEEFVSGDHTPHYHQPTDTFDKIDFPYLRRVSRVAFAATSSQVAPSAP